MLQIVTPADSHDLTVLATVKAELGISGSSEDALLSGYICQASDMISGWCGVETFAQETLRQTFRDVKRQKCLILDRGINVSVTTVVEDGTTLAGTDYEVDGSMLYRLADDLREDWSADKVVVTYQAGFVPLTNLPFAIERAVLDTVVNLYRGRGRDVAVRSEQTEGVGETQYFDGRRADVPPVTADRLTALSRYRRLAVG